MIAKGNRSKQVTDACKKFGGFYLGSIGGPAAILAKENIRKVEMLEYPELGMEAVWKSKSRISLRSSSWMTRATISSPMSAPPPTSRQRSSGWPSESDREVISFGLEPAHRAVHPSSAK